MGAKKLDVVSVRLLPEELEILQRKATEEGFLSLSAYIRSSLRRMIGAEQTDERSRFSLLESSLQKINERLRRLEGENTNPAGCGPDGPEVVD